MDHIFYTKDFDYADEDILTRQEIREHMRIRGYSDRHARPIGFRQSSPVR